MHSRDPSPFTPAARATTLPTPSIILPTAAKHHHHHRLHHPHQRHNHRGPNRAATQPQSGSGASGVSTADSDSLARVKTGEESGGGGGKDEKERKTWAVLRGKKVERELGDNYLRLRLQYLTTLSTTTTRRLDYTYYSLLSHASTISTLLTSLSTLSTTTPPILSLSLSTQQSQLSNLEKTIHSRQDQVKELQARLAASRAKVGKLGDRLGKVRGWIESVERGEREWGGKVRTRLRILAGAAVGVLVLLVLLQGWRICIFRGGNGRLGRNGDLFAGRVGVVGGVGGGGDVMRKRWNKMNLGTTGRAGMMAQEKNVGGSGSGSGIKGIQSVLLTPKGVRESRDNNAGTGGRMRKRWNDMNLGAVEHYAISSRDKLGSSGSSRSTHSVLLTPSAVKWQGARGNDKKEDKDEDPKLRVFDEL